MDRVDIRTVDIAKGEEYSPMLWTSDPMKRFASKHDRDVLYMLYDGRCAICKHELGIRFEVDHLVPYSEHRSTKLWNLQPLCQACHLDKHYASGKQKFSNIQMY
jgi:5-methylcytosine-specific restriction endonuclease McrA